MEGGNWMEERTGKRMGCVRIRCDVRQERGPEGPGNEWKSAICNLHLVWVGRDLGWGRIPGVSADDLI